MYGHDAQRDYRHHPGRPQIGEKYFFSASKRELYEMNRFSLHHPFSAKKGYIFQLIFVSFPFFVFLHN